MDYQKHYDLLISRAKVRELTSYTERHHIVPKCMGGSNNLSNIVKLTPEEHYVAHQLLIKIYPYNHSLKKAAWMMSVSSKNQKRNNKAYGWIKRSSRPSGSNNGMYGKTHEPDVCKKLGKLASERFLGKTYVELYGIDRANQIKEEKSKQRKEYLKLNPQTGSKNPNAKTYQITDPTGCVYKITGNLVKFCKDNGLWIAKIIDVSKGRIPDYKGWHITCL